MSNDNPGFRVGAPTSDVISRRTVQLKKWQESDTNQINPSAVKDSAIQFERKFMFLDSVAQQDIDEVRRLLDLGVDVNHTNPDGISALHQVSIDGNVEICQILLQHNPSLNAPDNDGWTPLHAAAQCGFTDLARMLLEAGAEVTCVDNEGELPIDKAEESDMQDLLGSWMKRIGVNLDEVRTAEERSLRDACEKAVRNKRMNKDLDIVTVDGATILHCAAAKGLADCITLLAKAGFDVNCQDFDGWTALHAAAKWSQPEAIDSLIENRADIHIVNTFAETPLDIADEDVIDMLKEYYDRSPTVRSIPIKVPGVEKFLNPELPDKSKILPIMKGTRKARENKENQPEKLPKPSEKPVKVIEETKNETPTKKNSRNRFEPETKPGPAPSAWSRKRDNAEKDVVSNSIDMEPVKPAVNKKPVDVPSNKCQKRKELDVPGKRPLTNCFGPDDAHNSAEVVRKTVSRRKREERRPTQHVNMDDIVASKEEQKQKPAEPVKQAATNGPEKPVLEPKPRAAPPTVQITQDGTLSWDKKSPEGDSSPQTPDTASGKAEVVRKKDARRKRAERRSTQHVSKDDLPGTPEKPTPDRGNNSETTVDTGSTQEKEDHLAKELELERLRYEENAAALARNQEDLRKREVKIGSLEKENENMKKKIAELEEDLRGLQQVKNDNQRLRDENAALIRVIGKLSRNPL